MMKSLKWMSLGLSVLSVDAFSLSSDRNAGQNGERVTLIDLPDGNRTAVVTDRNGTRVINKSGDSSPSGADRHDERVRYFTKLACAAQA